MLFQGINKSENWVCVNYTTTWKYDYDLALFMAQHIINEDLCEYFQYAATAEERGGDLTECTEQLKAARLSLRDCESTAAMKGTLAVAGLSRIMSCPLQFIFYADTNHMQVMSPAAEYFEKNGDHILDNYLNSVEIMAYCRRTERDTESRIEAEQSGSVSGSEKLQ
jgi:hypothetical protein